MPSDKCVMAKVIGLILFVVQHLYECPPLYSIADSKVLIWWQHVMASFALQKSSIFFKLVATLITEVLFKQFLIHTTVCNRLNIAATKHNGHFPDN